MAVAVQKAILLETAALEEMVVEALVVEEQLALAELPTLAVAVAVAVDFLHKTVVLEEVG